ncbi:GntR family transcriptional regulator [Pseudonocardia sp. GCM10023141]|uniref:GntR family transcriptional regulator n=1 Tax=Pseudonocardia sp. GCM10023141 TaxID=3252653 RepID=UPI003618D94D
MSYAEANPEAPRFAPPVTRPDNLTALVFAAIRDKIVDSSLPPGSSVSEASLAAQLQVSKTPVREALLRLRHIGLVEPGGRGLQVIQPSIAGIRDAFEFRAGIEAMAGRHAANRSTPEQQERILELASRSQEAAEGHDDANFLRCDQEFHLAIADAARNGVLREAVENSIILTRALRRRDVTARRDFVPDAREHIGIAEVIRAGSPELAATRIADHIHRIMLEMLDIDLGPVSS